MFPPSPSNSAREEGAGGGTVLVPMRFVWPHGGRRVSLIGSFTSWQEYLPMTPLEGCPTVFQAIYKLSPGYHEYKFFVDGQWRHDESQSSVAGNYGIVNRIFLDPVAILSNMEVENSGDLTSAWQTVGMPNYAIQEASPRISEADVAAFLSCTSTFLSTSSAYDLLPDSGKVVMLDVDLPVKQAFHILYEQGIPIAPLWNSYRAQFVGMLSPIDFILILRKLGHDSSLTDEELDTHTISAWKEGKHPLFDDPKRKRHFIHSSPVESLKEVATKIVQNGVSTVPIIQTPAGDGSVPQLLHLASLSGILKCICRHFRRSCSSFPIFQQPVGIFPLGTRVPDNGQTNGAPLAMLRPNDSLDDALNLLVQAQVSSLPIVDDNDSLLDVFSRSDITTLAKDRAYAQIHLNEMSIHQALELRREARSSHGSFNGQRCQTCLLSDSLFCVMDMLSLPGVRRIVVVEAGSKRVEGIISLRDVFKFLLG